MKIFQGFEPKARKKKCPEDSEIFKQPLISHLNKKCGYKSQLSYVKEIYVVILRSTGPQSNSCYSFSIKLTSYNIYKKVYPRNPILLLP